MKQAQPKKATTAGIAAAIFALLQSLLTSNNPLHILAGLFIVSAGFFVYLVEAGYA